MYVLYACARMCSRAHINEYSFSDDAIFLRLQNKIYMHVDMITTAVSYILHANTDWEMSVPRILINHLDRCSVTQICVDIFYANA